MDLTAQHIARLLYQSLSGDLSPAEQIELDRMLADEPHYQALYAQLQQDGFLDREVALKSGTDLDGLHEELYARITDKINFTTIDSTPAVPIVHRIHFLKGTWIRYAAAIIMLFGIGAYLYTTNRQKEKPAVAQVNEMPVKTDIAPGGNKAMLTLANGGTIVLDSAANGQLAREGYTKITKLASGQIEYVTDRPGAYMTEGSMALNTMSTPKGGQYELRLPDGTKVWLNAASSITYPVAFVSKDRTVSITGEVYFEVTKDPKKPFIVKTPKESVEVLGTHFNVNAYADEEAMKTSLLEGSVKIGAAILKPGQAYVMGKIVETNVDQDVAWKNGFFSFYKADVPAVMRQLARWYNIEVQYKGVIQPRTFEGELPRKLTLQQVLRLLKTMNLNFKLEGNTLIVQ